ncbi:MAG: hypothetical protein IJ756_06095 [Paludibacteraceae bacterium]|nr:hypothetical protein [Paludibacteraceae bacterium]
MAIVNLEVPFAEVHGTLVRNGIIHRQKKYKDNNGKVIFEGRQEAYAVRHPRDYKKNPPQGEKLRNINIFREANRLTTELILLDHKLKAAQASDNPEAAIQAILQDPETAEKVKQLQDYKSRFKKQIRKPDPHAPIDPQTHKHKQYRTLNTFIRALIYQALKAEESQKNLK